MFVTQFSRVAFARFLNPWTAVLHDPADQPGTSAGGDGAGDFDGNGDPGLHDDDGAADDLAGAGDRRAAGDDDEPLANLLVDEDEEELDDKGQPKTRTPEESVKALEKKNKKLRRALAKRGPIADQVRQSGFRDTSELMEAARGYQQIRQALNSGNRAEVLRLLGVSSDDKANARSKPGRTSASKDGVDLDDLEDVDFDESVESLGFDPKANKANEVLAKALRQVAHLTKAVKTLHGDRQQDRQLSARQQDQQLYGKWNDATKAAAQQITNPGHRRVFIDAIRSAFVLNRGKVAPDVVIKHYLKELGVNAGDAARANLKAKGAIVNRNQNQSRNQAPNGRPGSAASNEKPSLKSVLKKIQAGG